MRNAGLEETQAGIKIVGEISISRYFLADRLVRDMTIEQFLPQRKPRHYEHVVLKDRKSVG